MPKAPRKKGTHGSKKKEQERLSQNFKFKVSGKTHESEHPIGYEPIARGFDAKRGKHPYARQLENSAMAYQEVYELHRIHVGTGRQEDTEQTRAFKLTSVEYRGAQRELIESGHLGDAIQLNQMGYAFDQRTFDLWMKPEGQAATDSYNQMLVHTDELGYHDQGKTSVAQFSYQDKLEDFVARKIVSDKRYRSEQELAADKEEFDRLLTERRMEEWKGAVDPFTGEQYSSQIDEIRRRWNDNSNSSSSNSNSSSANSTSSSSLAMIDDRTSSSSNAFSLTPDEARKRPVAKRRRKELPSLDNNNNNINNINSIDAMVDTDRTVESARRTSSADPASNPFSPEARAESAPKRQRPAQPFELETRTTSTTSATRPVELPLPFEI